jgi:hypothetical protein
LLFVIDIASVADDLTAIGSALIQAQLADEEEQDNNDQECPRPEQPTAITAARTLATS